VTLGGRRGKVDTMCGRFTITSPAHVLADEFGLAAVASSFGPRFNLAPTQSVPVVTNWTQRTLELFRWGLIPSWSRDPAVGNMLINARCETVADKPSFRDAFERRRCLVLADGFYEWKKRGREKTPMYVRLKSGRPFAFAGLWEGWLSDEGEVIRTCTIVTTDANDALRPIHDRMPVILDAAARERWLAEASVAELEALMRPYPSDALEVYPVSPRVNSPGSDDPRCIEREAPRGTLPLFPDWS